MPMKSGRFLQSVNALAAAGADRLIPHGRFRRALSECYSRALELLTIGRGYPTEINGQMFRIDPRYRWAIRPAYEREIAEYLSSRVMPGSVCFDIGANVGVYVLQLSAWSAPNGRIVAFEPNPGTFPVLERHVALNGLVSRVTLVRKGVGASPGSALLYDSEAGSGLSRIGGSHPGIAVAVTPTRIDITTIDMYCAETGVVPDWILIDVEGYEFEVLRGAVDTLRRHAPRVVIELHDHILSEESRLAGERLLAELGLAVIPLGTVPGRQERFVTLGPM